MKKNIYLFWLFLFSIFSVWGNAQVEEIEEGRYQQERISERPFNEKKWEELTKDLDYSETVQKKKKKETVRTQDGTEGSDVEPNRRDPFSVEQGSGIMKFLIILLAVVVVVLLLRGLLGSDLRVKNKKIKKDSQIDIEQIEEDIENADLPDFIRRALNNGEYTLAVRLYYLAALKELSTRKDIRWQKDKTNLDYLREMRSSEHFEAFKALTSIFERVWYGERLLDREGFLQIEPGFKQFINQLKVDEPVQ